MMVALFTPPAKLNAAQPGDAGEPRDLGVVWFPSPNFDNRPANQAIDTIIIHTTDGPTYQGAIDRLTDISVPLANRVSAHYVIKSTGEIVQLVELSKRAWHATYYNNRSIGIEMVGLHDQKSTWNAQNLDALENLTAYLVKKYSIPIVHPQGDASTYPKCLFTESGLIGHSQIQPEPGCNAYKAKPDPGPYFPWERFVQNVQTKVSSKSSSQVGLDVSFYGQPQNPFSPSLVGQCTWFVYGKLLENHLLPNEKIFRGDASTWLDDAQKAGFFAGPQPANHAIAYWKSIGGSKWGHVAFVEDDSGMVTESNVGPEKTKLIIAMRDNDEVYYVDKNLGERTKLELGSPLPKPVTIPAASVWQIEEWESKTPPVEWARVNTQQFSEWLQRTQKVSLPQGKQSIWFKRDWDKQQVEGNFTGIRLTPGEPSYGKPTGYIYLNQRCSLGTGAPLLKLRSDAGLNQPVVATAKDGALMQVVEGPQPVGGLYWWKLKCQSDEGWVPTQWKVDTVFQAPPNCVVEVTQQFLWFHGALNAHGTFYVAINDNILYKILSWDPELKKEKIRDLPVGTETFVTGTTKNAVNRPWWNLVVEKDNGWSIVDRWGFTYPKD